jgi:hypothetical protein
MNIHAPTAPQALATISEDEALDAAARLQDWLRQRHGPADSAALDALLGQVGRQLPRAWSRDYPQDFRADAAYRATLPDLQNGPASLIRGARRTIQHVGIAGFRLPIRYRRRDGDPLTLETSVTGTVSLDAGKKGINMSRIMRSFYAHAEAAFSFEVIAAALDAYKADLESFDARIQMALSFPVRKASLRSGLEGWQYYDIALEMIDRGGLRTRSCISTMSIRRPAPVRWNWPSMRARPGASWRHRIRSARSRGCRWNLPAMRPCGSRIWSIWPARRPDRNPGDGQARGRTGLCRTERGQPDLCRGCRAAVRAGAAGRPADRRFPRRGQPSGKPAQP